MQSPIVLIELHAIYVWSCSMANFAMNNRCNVIFCLTMHLRGCVNALSICEANHRCGRNGMRAIKEINSASSSVCEPRCKSLSINYTSNFRIFCCCSQGNHMDERGRQCTYCLHKMHEANAVVVVHICWGLCGINQRQCRPAYNSSNNNKHTYTHVQ